MNEKNKNNPKSSFPNPLLSKRNYLIMSERVYCKTELYVQHEVFFNLLTDLKNELKKRNNKIENLPFTYEFMVFLLRSLNTNKERTVIESRNKVNSSQSQDNFELSPTNTDSQQHQSMKIEDMDEFLENME